MNPFLQVDFRGLLFGRERRPIQQVLLLRQDQLGAGDAVRGNQSDGADPFLPGGGDQCHCASFAVPDDGDALRIDVGTFGQHLDGGAGIFCEVGERGAFAAAAALADAALVVAEHFVARLGQRVRHLAENGNAEHHRVAIVRSAAADQDHGRPARCARRAARGSRRFRQRARQREPVGWNMQLFIVRPRDRDAARRHGGNVLAHDVERLRRQAEARQPAGIVSPDVAVKPGVRQVERDVRAACRYEAAGGLKLLGSGVADENREADLRGAENLDHRPRCGGFQPQGQRFVGTEERIREHHQRIAGDRVVRARRLSGNDDFRARPLAVDERMNALRLAAHGPVERKLDRLPLGGITDLNAAGDGIERRADAAGALDRPSIGAAVDSDLLGAYGRAADEDRERHGAGNRCICRSGLSRCGDRR